MRELDPTTALPSTLEYASPRDRRRWGPVVFWTSGSALVLLALTVAGAAWLGLRHHPWRPVGEVLAPQLLRNSFTRSPFTRDGLLITVDAQHGIDLRDPVTGRLVRNIVPNIDTTAYHYFTVKGGEEVLALPNRGATGMFFGVRSGACSGECHCPQGSEIPCRWSIRTGAVWS
jgi:hypothetical protein